MVITINNIRYKCLNTHLPIKKYINNADKKLENILYYSAIREETNKLYRIYNRGNLNKYRLSLMFDGCCFPGVNSLQDEDSYKNTGHLCVPRNYLDYLGINKQIKFDMDAIYDTELIKKISFLPNIFDINDNYVIYEIGNEYTVPKIIDMVDKIDLFKNIIFKTTEDLKGSLVYSKIIKDITSFNRDAIRFISNEQPFFENLKGLGIYDISFDIETKDSSHNLEFYIDKSLNNWLYVNIHELFPVPITKLNDDAVNSNDSYLFKNKTITFFDDLQQDT